jgi:hypothetical protein
MANSWDNKARGFAYMTDERGLRLEQIPEGRGFTPAYRPYAFDMRGSRPGLQVGKGTLHDA